MQESEPTGEKSIVYMVPSGSGKAVFYFHTECDKKYYTIRPQLSEEPKLIAREHVNNPMETLAQQYSWRIGDHQ